MKHLKTFIILNSLCGLVSSFVLPAQFDQKATEDLSVVLAGFVHRCKETGKKPAPEELSPIVKNLIEGGADPNVINTSGNKTCPLHFAAEAGDVDLIDFLLERGASIESEGSENRTPLFQMKAKNGCQAQFATQELCSHSSILALEKIKLPTDGYG